MSCAVDANVLVYASNDEAAEHDAGLHLLERLATGTELVVLAWPVVMAYLRIATHQAMFSRPLAMSDAVGDVEALLSRPNVRAVAPGGRYWAIFAELSREVPTRGNGVPDAQIVALMIEHGVAVIWSRDRDFRKYTQISLKDPFDA